MAFSCNFKLSNLAESSTNKICYFMSIHVMLLAPCCRKRDISETQNIFHLNGERLWFTSKKSIHTMNISM